MQLNPDMPNMTLFIPSQQTLFYVGWRSFHHKGYLVAYHRQSDTVGVTKYGTCSCNNTDELFADETWELLNWEYKGATSDFYALCRDHRDMKLPERKVEQEDFNAKWVLRLHDVFCEFSSLHRFTYSHSQTGRPKFSVLSKRAGQSLRALCCLSAQQECTDSKSRVSYAKMQKKRQFTKQQPMSAALLEGYS